MQREQDLHEIMPDGFFWNEAVVFLRLLDDGGQVAAPTILHEDVELPCLAVNVAVIVSHDMVVV